MPSQTYSDSQTQPFSQLSPFPSHNYQVDDEEKEGVWGYLVPIDTKSSRYGALVLKDRQACTSDPGDRVREKSSITKEEVKDQEEDIEKSKREGKPSKGYLVGRHPECGMLAVCTPCDVLPADRFFS
jgi:serine/threonine-protein kinase Chk2